MRKLKPFVKKLAEDSIRETRPDLMLHFFLIKMRRRVEVRELKSESAPFPLKNTAATTQHFMPHN